MSGPHANNLSTHKNVYLPESKKASGGATTGFKKVEEEVVHCCLCKEDCSKQQRYHKNQVSCCVVFALLTRCSMRGVFPWMIYVS